MSKNKKRNPCELTALKIAIEKLEAKNKKAVHGQEAACHRNNLT